MTDMKKTIRRPLYIVFTAVICLHLCAFLQSNAGFTINTEENHVYTYVTVSDLLKQQNSDEKAAKEKYDGQYILLAGEFEQKKFGQGSFTVMTGGGDYSSVTCQTRSGSAVDLNSYSFQDKVAVYGKCSMDFLTVRVTDVEKIIPAPPVISKDCFFTLDGISLDRQDALQRSLNDGKIRYYIPKHWKSIEADICENDLGIIEGRQYVLNYSKGSKNNVPESLFVCYFDKELLVDKQDIDGFARKKVERMIIKNINGSNDSLSSNSENTYFGVLYDRYLCRYSDPFNMDGYRTEYIFQPYGSDGLIMYMYLYREPEHLSEVMLVTRMLEAS